MPKTTQRASSRIRVRPGLFDFTAHALSQKRKWSYVVRILKDLAGSNVPEECGGQQIAGKENLRRQGIVNFKANSNGEEGCNQEV